MMPRFFPALTLLAFLVQSQSLGAGDADKDGFIPLFNGKDLAGWVNVNCAPETFFVKDQMIITTGKPTGFLRTEKQYENFILELEWMHMNQKEIGNSGLFVWGDPLPAVGTGYTRGIEVQVLVNLEKEGFYTSHGDIFSIHGAKCKPDRPHPNGWDRCLPSERRCKGGGQWNHYKVIAQNGAIKLHVNGKEVSGVNQCNPRKGYLALESEGAECRFKNIKIKELPSTNPRPEEIAEVAQDFKPLYTGLDLRGWRVDEAGKKHWQPRDWILHYDGKGERKNNGLATQKEFGNAQFIVDFRFPAKKEVKPTACSFSFREGKDRFLSINVFGAEKAANTLRVDGDSVKVGTGWSLKNLKPNGQWNRLIATLKGQSLMVAINGTDYEVTDRLPATNGFFVLRPEGEVSIGNLFVRELK